MANILSQDEVDALLKSFQEEEESGPEAVDESDRSPSLVTAGAPGTVWNYDFRRPNRISKDQLRQLQSLHEAYAFATSGVLSGYLRTLVEVQVVSLEQLTYAEWVHGLPEIACLYPFSMEPLQGSGVMELTTETVLSVIDRLLGGRGDNVSSLRELTQLEATLASQLVDDSLRVLGDAWAEVIRFTPQRQGYEKHPSMLRLLPDTETILLATFKLKTQYAQGTFSLCYPFVAVEPGIANLTSAYYAVGFRPQGSPEGTAWLVAGLEEGRVPVSVRLGEGGVTIGEFIHLRPGDVIRLGTRIAEPLRIFVGGRPKLSGHPGLVGRQLAVRLGGRLAPLTSGAGAEPGNEAVEQQRQGREHPSEGGARDERGTPPQGRSDGAAGSAEPSGGAHALSGRDVAGGR
ncbi:MAG: flagellar motor switch protein FliM [Candidatus Eisenbacteria sp.]|nr:flagellar motor switch protein FliM [Candidatus Eisenbacteria bacterium]